MRDVMSEDRRIVSLARVFAACAYALFCAIAIALLSASDYDWMLGEKEADGTALGVCSIPIPADDAADVTRLLTLAMVMGLLVPGLACLIKRRQIGLHLLLGVALLIFWGYRFWSRAFLCN
jgi:hypothetical protein